ncbi:MAG: UTP--glucose-1-phosphate uridylyltransferase [Gemmataceae bacterium]
MSGVLRAIIEAEDDAVRNRAAEEACRGRDAAWLLAECDDLERFRRGSASLYHRVRALFFLYALHRFHLPVRPEVARRGPIPFAGQQHLLNRRFDEAVDAFLGEMRRRGPSAPLSSALAEAYRAFGFQTLANQVRRSVRAVRGNQWMFRTGHPSEHPLRVRPELLTRAGGSYPVLRERTPVRMDLTHSAWSDIFFLGMDFPEGARVLNVSIDLGVRGRDALPRPPIEVHLRVVPEPVLRLVSVDLGAAADITSLAEVFDFARDYLGLLKAAVIASGLVPAGLEGAGQGLPDLLALLVGPGRGLELVSSVNDIPKGSRLAVSTNLLAGLIAACMRATGQTKSLTGPLDEGERRLVAARAILGEWLAGSGGGWQDSGGVWPGIKLIEGVASEPGGDSRGQLLPRHAVLGEDRVPAAARDALQSSLILVHGGLAQNVGPILEMVTEKYLLRSPREWDARKQALGLLDHILAALAAGDVRALAEATTRNFGGPIQDIIPAASNAYTERLIADARGQFGPDFWGFWMLGGMSGGGMGFIVAPERKREAQDFLLASMARASDEMRHALPFAMTPVVYDFAINPHGTRADLLHGDGAMMPAGYYTLQIPGWLRTDPRLLPPSRHEELTRFGAACRERPEMAGAVQTLFDRLLPRGPAEAGGDRLAALLRENGFDPEQHERMRADLLHGRIGLAQNRLPVSSLVEDVGDGDVTDATGPLPADLRELGERSLRAGEVAVVTLAAGAGSRWSQGAGTVKALHPFWRFAGAHRSFLEVSLAKSRRASRRWGTPVPHVFSTGYLTHEPVARHLARLGPRGDPGRVVISPGRAVGLRLVPTARDLRFAWEETARQRLDVQAQKVRDSAQAALLDWARSAGEAADYADNLPLQCIHPLGHWNEVPNMLRNGTLARLLAARPGLRHLLVQNVDAVGTDVDPGLLGLHLAGEKCLTFEVIHRHIEDHGGGLARVDGRLRLVEGLALGRPEDEAKLTYYNTLTNWVDIDRCLASFGLERGDLGDGPRVAEAVARVAARVPTYITHKDVKRRWGNGQEDTYPVSQSEKLWGDMTTLAEVPCRFVAVPRHRGRQLKEQGQLDGWSRDGGREFVEAACEW